MASNQPQLRILFIPFMAPGHMIPMVDMAKLFSVRGVKSIILTTYGNSSFIPTTKNVQVHLVPFPSNNLLPKGVENVSSLPSIKDQLKFVMPTRALRPAFEEALREICPDVVVSDMMFPWTVEVAADLGIPRILFHGSNFFSQCAGHSAAHHKIHDILLSDDDTNDTVLLPGLPHKIEMMKTQMPHFTKIDTDFVNLLKEIKEAESKSYGVVVNSFYELEPDYVQYYKDVIGMKAWHVGPVSLCNKDVVEKGSRGNVCVDVQNKCLKWLDAQQHGSVLYVCFGSLAGDFSIEQLGEMAKGLEESGRPFVWVVRNAGQTSEWISSGLEDMVNEGKGLIIKGWAPQVLILNHGSVGGFMTHCGWNSCLESLLAALPTITWPLAAEQFYNEKLIVEILKTGVAIGQPKYTWNEEEGVLLNADEIKKAIERVMDGREEAQSLRKRAMEVGKMAMAAMKCGGSSYESMGLLIEELSGLKAK